MPTGRHGMSSAGAILVLLVVLVPLSLIALVLIVVRAFLLAAGCARFGFFRLFFLVILGATLARPMNQIIPLVLGYLLAVSDGLEVVGQKEHYCTSGGTAVPTVNFAGAVTQGAEHALEFTYLLALVPSAAREAITELEFCVGVNAWRSRGLRLSARLTSGAGSAAVTCARKDEHGEHNNRTTNDPVQCFSVLHR